MNLDLIYKIKDEEKLLQDSEYKKLKENLTKKFRKIASMNDVKWAYLNNKSLEYSISKQMGLFRNTKMDMAFLLKEEKKLKYALQMFFEVCYLDINGVMNGYGFNINLSLLAPGILWEIRDIISKLKLSYKECKILFMEWIKKVCPYKKMPITPEKAWLILLKRIKYKGNVYDLDHNLNLNKRKDVEEE